MTDHRYWRPIDATPPGTPGYTEEFVAELRPHPYEDQPDGMEEERVAARGWPIAQLAARAIHLGYDSHALAARRLASQSSELDALLAWTRTEMFGRWRDQSDMGRQCRAAGRPWLRWSGRSGFRPARLVWRP